jgi:hypothetical protein
MDPTTEHGWWIWRTTEVFSKISARLLDIPASHRKKRGNFNEFPTGGARPRDANRR